MGLNGRYGRVSKLPIPKKRLCVVLDIRDVDVCLGNAYAVIAISLVNFSLVQLPRQGLDCRGYASHTVFGASHRPAQIDSLHSCPIL